MNAAQFRTALQRFAEDFSATGQPVTFSQLTLEGEDLSGVNGAGATFVNCDFSRCNFSNSDFASATFSGCRLLGANFTGANLFDARFEESSQAPVEATDLSNADLTRATATNAHFSNVILNGMLAEFADFEGADFSGSPLTAVTLDRANLKGATAVVLDGTRTHFTEFSANASDAWSQLRSTFTGLRLAFHLIPVVLFVFILISKTVVLYGTAYLGAAVESRQSVAEYCAESNCRRVRLVAIVSGWDQGYLAFSFVLFSLVFNASRFVVTARVNDLREAEDRTRRSPAYASYHNLVRPAQWLAIGVYINLALFAVNLADVLWTSLLVPPLQ